MPSKACTVSITDTNGMTHSVEVVAESLYEAAVRGLRKLRDDGWTPRGHGSSRMTIEARPLSQERVVRHSIAISRLLTWLEIHTGPRDYAKQAELRRLLYTAETPTSS